MHAVPAGQSASAAHVSSGGREAQVPLTQASLAAQSASVVQAVSELAKHDPALHKAPAGQSASEAQSGRQSPSLQVLPAAQDWSAAHAATANADFCWASGWVDDPEHANDERAVNAATRMIERQRMLMTSVLSFSNRQAIRGHDDLARKTRLRATPVQQKMHLIHFENSI